MRLTPALVLAVPMLASLPLAAAEPPVPSACHAATAVALHARGVEAGEVGAVLFVVERPDKGGDHLGWTEAWVRLAGRPGTIVVRLDHQCRAGTVYARDGARLPDRAPRVAGPAS